MKVLKFGGTSVGTIESLTNVKKIVDGLDRPAVVVVSALGGLTDRLISTAKAASEGKDSFEEAMIEFRLRHHNIIEALVPEVKRVETRKKVDTLLDQLGDIYRGLYQSKTLPERTLDLVVSFGERMSSIIVAELLKEAEHKDSLSFMRTERWFNKNRVGRHLLERWRAWRHRRRRGIERLERCEQLRFCVHHAIWRVKKARIVNLASAARVMQQDAPFCVARKVQVAGLNLGRFQIDIVCRKRIGKKRKDSPKKAH